MFFFFFYFFYYLTNEERFSYEFANTVERLARFSSRFFAASRKMNLKTFEARTTRSVSPFGKIQFFYFPRVFDEVSLVAQLSQMIIN